jgi:hypothetical protein
VGPRRGCRVTSSFPSSFAPFASFRHAEARRAPTPGFASFALRPLKGARRGERGEHRGGGPGPWGGKANPQASLFLDPEARHLSPADLRRLTDEELDRRIKAGSGRLLARWRKGRETPPGHKGPSLQSTEPVDQPRIAEGIPNLGPTTQSPTTAGRKAGRS